MASVFINKHDRVPVQVNGGKDTVFIKRKMGYGNVQRLADAMVRIELAEGGTTTQTVRFHEQDVELLKTNIVAWSFVDDRGKPVPVSDENIEQLDPDSDVVELVLAAIKKQNPGKVPQAEEDAPDPKSESGGATNTPPTPTD